MKTTLHNVSSITQLFNLNSTKLMKQTKICAMRMLPLIMGASFPVSAQDLPYSSGSTGADGAFVVPRQLPHREGFASAYDTARNEVVVFGGYGRGEAEVQVDGIKTETWVFNGTAWTQRSPATFVSARENASMVYDSVRQECVMFGGRRADGVYLNETWVWNGTNWTRKTPATSPSARWHHEMVWDSQNNRVLLFGGRSEAPATDHKDTWAWNGTTWAQLAVTAPPGDASGNYSYETYDAMAWDSTANKAVLFNPVLARTWTFDGTTWTYVPSGQVPASGQEPRMVYDPVRQEVVLGPGSSSNTTWTYKAGEWSQKSPATQPPHRYAYGLVWHGGQQKVLMFNGYSGPQAATNTYSWNGTDWQFVVGNSYIFSMAGRASGVWNYTSIEIPLGVSVFFTRNVQNSPVTWLATENVTVSGRVYLNGQDGPPNDLSGSVAQAGPGGFDGGQGAVRWDVSGSYAARAGQGPGGGAPGVTASQQGVSATYAGTYGNTMIQPLLGGSGGGGGASSISANGGNGGAGGGAIEIRSSKDILISGSIYANGGAASHGGATYGGGGSGGAIKLVADRISGTGRAEAKGGYPNNNLGRIRLEAFYRPFATQSSPVPSATAPTSAPALAGAPRLWIENVAGAAVGPTPTGSLATPDVVFTNAGSVTIQVKAENVPSGTPVKLRLTTTTGVITLPETGAAAVTLNGTGNAVFTTVVPRGQGTVQAFAEFNITP